MMIRFNPFFKDDTFPHQSKAAQQPGLPMPVYLNHLPLTHHKSWDLAVPVPHEID